MFTCYGFTPAARGGASSAPLTVCACHLYCLFTSFFQGPGAYDNDPSDFARNYQARTVGKSERFNPKTLVGAEPVKGSTQATGIGMCLVACSHSLAACWLFALCGRARVTWPWSVRLVQLQHAVQQATTKIKGRWELHLCLSHGQVWAQASCWCSRLPPWPCE